MSKPDLRISVLSDVHITHYGDGAEQFENALKFHTESLPESDMYLFTGDIIYQLDSGNDPVCHKVYESNYDIMLETVNRYIPDTPKVYVVGNHEFPQNNTDPELTTQAMEMWERKIGQFPSEHVILNNYHFIKAPILSWAMEPSPELEYWLKNEIEIALSDEDKPVFLLTHTALHNTVGCSRPSPASFSEDFRKFLTKHPRVIHISGHMHNHVLDEKSIYQEGFTSLSAPVCAVGYICMGGCNYLNPPVFGFSQSLFLEITDRKVTVHKVDLVSKKTIGDPWIIDIDETEKGIFRYGKDRCETAPRPVFASDASVTASCTDNNISVTVSQKTANDTLAHYYIIKLENEQGDIVLTQTEHSDFYNLSIDMPRAETMTFTISEAVPSGTYTVHVFAANSFFAHNDCSVHCTLSV